MLRLTLRTLFLMSTVSFLSVNAEPSAVKAVSSNNIAWQSNSTGTATWLFMDIYTAELFSQEAKLPKNFLVDGVPLRLKLCYLKSISADILIEGAQEVLPDNLSGALQKEVNRLHAAYQDVVPGDCYELAYTPESGTQLIFNGKVVFSSQEAKFKALYFGIWLGNEPLSDSLKASLIKEV